MKRIAVIAAVLEEPKQCQQAFNNVVAAFNGVIKGRMGIPLEEYRISVVTLTVIAELNEINSLTGKLGKISGVTVKTAINTKELEDEGEKHGK